MRPKTASRTAEYAATFRALESARLPAASRLFEDPFAVDFLSLGKRILVGTSGLPWIGAGVRAYVDHRWPGAMTSGIARTRLIDDWMEESLLAGTWTVILLGAGFDCRASRLATLRDCRVIEVDHPATQAEKRARLQRTQGDASTRVAFVPADLTIRPLGEVLDAAGVDATTKTMVVWEGVTHYLGETAVDATLRVLASRLAPESRLIFTYLHGGLLDGSVVFDGARASADQVAGEGEPWIWGLEPSRMPEFLTARGFRLLNDLGADEYRELYWGERGRHMRGFAFYRVAMAEVGS